MARSKHTIPPRIRAPRRVRAPDAPRGDRDPSIRNRIVRELKLAGVAPLPDGAGTIRGAPPLPRVIVKRPRPGYVHPAGRAAVAQLLRLLGPRCTYGLRTVELVQGGTASPDRALVLGRLLVPGRVQLFDQPVSPWVLHGVLPARQEAQLRGQERWSSGSAGFRPSSRGPAGRWLTSCCSTC